jgi:hypothetical protein
MSIATTGRTTSEHFEQSTQDPSKLSNISAQTFSKAW